MKYEYQPSLLKTWLRDTRNQLPPAGMVNVNEKYKGAIESLKEEFRDVRSGTNQDWENWEQTLTIRQKLLLPNLYEPDLALQVKYRLLKTLEKYVKHERRMFRVLVDSVYTTCDVKDLWALTKSSFAVHHERLQRRMTSEQSTKWKELTISSEPIKYMATTAWESEKNFLEELETFYLTDNFPLFKLVLMEVFAHADEDFFIKEKELFKSHFKQATGVEQQEMAQHLIASCKLNNVRDVGELIYERLKTYTRKPMLWKHVGEKEKDRFSQWVIKLQLKDFFSKVNTSHERFVYWEKFISKLRDVVVIDNNETLIMYFEKEVIMEVLSTGAVYVYDNRTFKQIFQPKIDDLLREREKKTSRYFVPNDLKRAAMMDKSLVANNGYGEGWLRHAGEWQDKFDEWLKFSLQWEVDRDALLQKAERDEG